MAKCKMCGRGGLFSRVDSIGLCGSCHNRYINTVPRLFDIYKESMELVKTSRNIETKVSRMQLAIGKLEEIKLFGNGLDVMNLVDPNIHVDEIINMGKSAYQDLLDARNEFDGVIIDMLGQLGEASRKQIAEIIKANAANAGATPESFPYDVEKMLPDMLKRLVREGRIVEMKSGNKYVYSLSE